MPSPTPPPSPPLNSWSSKPEKKAEKAGREERQERHAGEIIPPAPPCFCLPASPVRQAGAGGKAGRVAKDGRKYGKAMQRGLECLAGSVRAAYSVQVCAAAPTCGGRLLSDKSRTVVSKEIFPDCYRRRNRPSVVESISVQPPGRGKCLPECCLPTLWGPGRRQASSRNSLPALNAAAVVQAKQSAQRVLCKRDMTDAGRSHVCAHLRWPTSVRPAPDSRVKGRDFQIFIGEGIGPVWWSRFRFSRRGRENVCRKAVSQRTGAPGDVRSPADGRQAAGIHFRR